jgi:EpsI family protein
MHRLSAFIPAALLFVGVGLEWRARGQVAAPLVRPISSVMAGFPGYGVEDQVISDRERRIAGMTDYVARVYRRDGEVAFTTLVSYYDRQTKGKTIHSPRNCLPGAGWEIINGQERVITVNGVSRTVNRYVLRNRNSTAVAYYWYQGRGRVTSNEYVVKWNLLRDAALAGRTEEALVRVVVPVDSASRAQAERGPVVAADVLAETIVGRLMTDVNSVLPRAGA